VPHPIRGQNVAAAVVAAEGASPDAEQLRARLKQELSAYKVPKHLFFFRRDELPFTDSGKIDRRRLTAMLTERLAKESAD
jgi:acyl-coenzyme A synthetase/AMP-(fatty) acid ligase